MYTARVKDKAIFSHKINGDIYGCWYVRIYLCILHSYQLSEFHAAFSCVFYAFLNELKLSDVSIQVTGFEELYCYYRHLFAGM